MTGNSRLFSRACHGTLSACAVGAFLAVIASCGGDGVGPGSVAPDFVLDDLGGNRFYLSAQRGKPVLVNFWSVHCVPCVREMPALQRLWHKFRDRGVIVVGVCVDRSETGYLEEYVRGLKVDYPILADSDASTSRRYGVRELPTTFVVDAGGTVRHRAVGYEDGYVDIYDAQVEKLLRKEARRAGR